MNRPADPEVGLVIPVHNEEAVLPLLLQSLDQLDLGVPFRVLFVDDGSTDGSYAMMERACSQDARFACLRLSRNFGHQAAVTAGLRQIRGDVVAVIDADLQDPPELLRSFLEAWREGFDVVYGIRTGRKEPWPLRAAYATYYRLLSKVADVRIPRDAGDFALMDRRVVDVLRAMPEHNRFVRGLRAWAGFRQTGIPYERLARPAGKSSYSLRRLMRLALDGMLSFSAMPLRLASWVGAAVAMGGFGFLVLVIILNLVGRPMPPGWASVIVIVLFLGGIQLLVLGIVGEYLGRIFDEVKRRPHYVVQDAVGWVKS